MNNKFKFKTFNYNLKDLLTPTDISLAVNHFYLNELADVGPEWRFSIIFGVITPDGNWKNISSLQTLNIRQIDNLKEVFKSHWDCKSDIYKGLTIEKIIFRYKFLEFEIVPRKPIFKYPTDLDKKGELLYKYFPSLPNNRIFETWGNHISIDGNNYEIYLDDKSFFITQLDNEYFIWLKDDDLEILYFHDIYECNDESNNTFIRIIGDYVLYYNNGVCHYLKG
jgi:hypothetical protein